MMRKVLYTSWPIALLTAIITITPAEAQVSAQGPYYASPSWSQNLPSFYRFVILEDWNYEAVLDRETGLVWTRSPLPRAAVQGAAAVDCVRLQVGGRMGWRLPGLHELQSLIDPTVLAPGPFLPVGHPFLNFPVGVGGGNLNYWTATMSPGGSTPAFWGVTLKSSSQSGAGFVSLFEANTNLLHAWCVRGGGILSAY